MNEQADPGKRKRTKLSDVAARAGVSPVTVSRVLRNPAIVSRDLRYRVEEAIRELAYIPNNLASSLASSRTHRIGVVVPSLTNGVFGDYIQSIHAVLEPAGFQVLVLNSSYEAEMEERAIATMLGQHPEAMIVTGVDQTERARKMLVHAAVPVIQTLELAEKPIDISIGLSQRDAGYEATRYLISLGHRRVAHMASPLDQRAQRRLAGYFDAISEAGLTPITISIDQASSFPLGARLLAELYRQHPEMTAVACGNDNLALGALFEAQRLGIRVPGGHLDRRLQRPRIRRRFPAVPHHDHDAARGHRPARRRDRSGDRPRLGRAPARKRIDVGFRLVERESTAAPPR